jgi:hypothetical protein
MHNIDRNLLESGFETGPFETGEFEFEQFEGPHSEEFGQEAEQYEGGYSHEFGQEAEGWSGEAEAYEAYGTQGESTFSEAEEMELAAELLEIATEQEFEQFLGRLVKRIARGASSFIKSPIGQALGGALKGLAQKAIPLAGTALGGLVGGPIGAQIGRGLASAAGQAIGLEAETMSHEDREFEGARQFVRIAGQTARQMSMSRRGDPRYAAQQAMFRAVRRNAPGLLQAQPYGDYAASQDGYANTTYGNASYGGGYGRRQSGRWMRRGSRIVLLGV